MTIGRLVTSILTVVAVLTPLGDDRLLALIAADVPLAAGDAPPGVKQPWTAGRLTPSKTLTQAAASGSTSDRALVVRPATCVGGLGRRGRGGGRSRSAVSRRPSGHVAVRRASGRDGRNALQSGVASAEGRLRARQRRVSRAAERTGRAPERVSCSRAPIDL
ncbi:hypothetical protein ABLN79_15930 [Mycobacterium tuberculosis]